MNRKPITLDDIEGRMLDAHHLPFGNWLRQIVGLSSGGLTLLVGLQSQYIPKQPQDLWLLKLSWACLALSVLSGMIALRSEWQTPLDALNELRQIRQKGGDSVAIYFLQTDYGKRPRIIYRLSYFLTFWTFVVSVISLAIFAILNLG